MVAVPKAIPETIPVVEPIDAVPGALLLHVPPASELDNVVVEPRHAIMIPAMGAGVAVTVTIAMALQPATVYKIVAVPGLIPVTMPVEEPTVPIVGVALLHVPPEVELESVVVKPVHA